MVHSAVTSGATKINTGSTSAVAPYIADTDFSGGATITRTHTIDLSRAENPAPAAVYQSQRYNNMTYTLPGFTKGTYSTIRLHFCDTHWTMAGQRKFNVSINGTQVLTSFDIIATVGAGDRALIKTFTMPANSSGQFVIAFTGVLDSATISAIEVTPVPSATSTYAADCVAAGVPLPPSWGSFNIGAGKSWTDRLIYTDTFLEELQGHIYFSQIASPAGLCVINAHGDVNSANLFDVICQGATNGKACFWEGTQVPAPVPHDVNLVNGSWTPTGSPVVSGIAANPHPGTLGCTNCHAGQNVFISHFVPNHPLNLLGVATGWMPTTWYSPVDDPVLPQNAGPDTFVEYPASTSNCLSCHVQGGQAGPFPRLSTVGYQSEAGETYCQVLKAVANRPSAEGGMPPGNTCDPFIDMNCAGQTDPFVIEMLNTCDGLAVSRANSPVAVEATAAQGGVADHAVVDKWVSGFRQVWQLDNSFSGGHFNGWTGTDQTNILMSEFRATAFFRGSQLVLAATDQTGTIWELPDNAPVTALSPVNAAGSPTGFVRHDGSSTIDFRGTDQSIYEARWDGTSAWLTTLLPGQAGFPATGDPRGYRRSSQSSAVIYMCGAQICEERFTSTGWHFRGITPAVRKAPFVAAPLATPDTKWAIFYVGEDGLHQILDTCDPDPSFNCATTDTLIYANQNIVSAPAPYVDQSGGVSIAMITDSNGASSSQVVQLSRTRTGTTWTATTLYTAAKSTETLVGDPAAYLATATTANTILFRNSAFKTYELQWSTSQNKYVLTTITF
jgi:hypothetical protein